MDATTQLDPQDVLDALRSTLGPQAVLDPWGQPLGPKPVLTGPDIPARNCNDGSATLPQTPLAVVRPLNAAGVSLAIAACRKARLPFVPQGGLTGLCGGATPA